MRFDVYVYFPFFSIVLLQCARQGFALGLTILVGTVPSIRLESLLKLITTLLEVNSSMKGQVGKCPFSNEIANCDLYFIYV